ncbi:MAG TPA: hypothetical protein VME23_20655 [Terracidiphilus sp.]|nr:hypothetical protein [Terracidiphilus sp.]
MLAKRNHRLNAFRYLNLSDFGADYQATSNADMKDIGFPLD